MNRPSYFSPRVIGTFFTFLCSLALVDIAEASPKRAPDKIIAFKEVNSKDGNRTQLKLHVFEAKGNKSDKKTCIVFFFGGGWFGGSPSQFYQQSDYFSEKGIVCISAEYRTASRHGVKPDKCVEDGKSAIRWVRQNAAKLGVDPNKIVAAGGSAGGHVAACTGVVEGFEAKEEDAKISSKPIAMMLFNPVLDTTKKGYGAAKVKGFGNKLSPCHLVKKGIVPTIVFHGDKDKTVPYENAERFHKLMLEAGNVSELKKHSGKDHGFFNGSWMRPKNGDAAFTATMKQSEEFLKKLKLMP